MWPQPTGSDLTAGSSNSSVQGLQRLDARPSLLEYTVPKSSPWPRRRVAACPPITNHPVKSATHLTGLEPASLLSPGAPDKAVEPALMRLSRASCCRLSHDRTSFLSSLVLHHRPL